MLFKIYIDNNVYIVFMQTFGHLMHYLVNGVWAKMSSISNCYNSSATLQSLVPEPQKVGIGHIVPFIAEYSVIFFFCSCESVADLSNFCEPMVFNVANCISIKC